MTSNQQQLWMNNSALDHNGAAPPHYVKADYYRSNKHLARPGKKGSARAIIITVVAAIVAMAVVGGVGVAVAIGVGAVNLSNSETNNNTTGSNVGSTLSPSLSPLTPTTLAPVTPAPTKFPTAPVTAAPTKFPTTASCATVNIGEVISPLENSYIQLVFTTCPSAGGADAFLAAATRWSKIISQNKIASRSFNSDLSLTGNVCLFLQNDVIIPAGFIFSHLVIFVETVPIDNAGGVLASSGPCLLDGNNVFPLAGGMRFDSADIDALEVSGSLDDVVLHEMGHVLGIGTLWQRSRLLDNPMLITTNGVTSVNPNGNPQYNGVNGRDGFKAVKGLSTRPASVPVEDFKFPNGNRDPLTGQGSVDGHWDFEDLQPELMVFQIDPSQSFHPLSLLTLKSLQDFTYVVNETLADPFSVSRSSSKEASNSSEVIDLSGDIPGNHIFTPEEIDAAYAATGSSGLRGNNDIIVLKYNQSVI